MLIVTGTLAFDFIMDFPGKFGDHILAGQEHSINLSFIVNKFARRRGGTAGNVSYSLGLLGMDHILFSAAGSDFGEYARVFEKMGIDTKHVLIDKNNYTATGVAITDKTDNQIWGYFYGAADRIVEMDLKKVAKKGDMVIIGPSGSSGSMSFIKQCIKLGLDYMFDPGFILTQVSDKDLRLGVEHAKYLIGNDYEINLIKSRIADFAALTADSTVITTLGKKGAVIENDAEKIRVSGVVVENVVDPTGAGDAWRSGFLAGLKLGFDLKSCGQMGSVAAAYAVEQYGTQEHKYTKQQFTKRYQLTYNSRIDI